MSVIVCHYRKSLGQHPSVDASPWQKRVQCSSQTPVRASERPGYALAKPAPACLQAQENCTT